MAFDPSIIINKEFSNAFRGYDSVEVDEFLESLVQEFRTMADELKQNEEELEELREQVSMYQDMEDTMKSSLSSAQRTADKVLENAYHEADLITRRAQLQADKEVSVALRDSERQLVANRRKAEQILAEAQKEAERWMEQADAAKKRVRECGDQIRSMLVDQLDLLERDPALQTDDTEEKPQVKKTVSDDLYAGLPYEKD